MASAVMWVPFYADIKHVVNKRRIADIEPSAGYATSGKPRMSYSSDKPLNKDIFQQASRYI